MTVQNPGAHGSSQLCFFKAQVIFQHACLSALESQSNNLCGTNSATALQLFYTYMHTIWEGLKIISINCDARFLTYLRPFWVWQPPSLEFWFGKAVVK